MTPESAIQILGVIVQTYGGILAIGAGFFTFLFQHFKEELTNTQKKIERNMETITEVLMPHGLWSDATNLRMGILKHGPKWVEEEMQRINKRNNLGITLRRGHLQALENIKADYPKYQKLKKRSETVPYKLFIIFLIYCGSIIISSLISMGLMDVIVELGFTNMIVWFIEGLSSVGVVYLAFLAWALIKV